MTGRPSRHPPIFPAATSWRSGLRQAPRLSAPYRHKQQGLPRLPLRPVPSSYILFSEYRLVEQFGFFEVLSVFVLGTQQHFLFGYWPVDADGGVVETDAGLCLGSIHVVHLISKHGLVAQHKESMGHSTGDKQLALVLLAQLYGHILAEGGRTLADVDSHIDDGALDDTHQLGLRELSFLIMKATEHAAAALRLIVLDEVNLTDMGLEFFFFPGLKKIPT